VGNGCSTITKAGKKMMRKKSEEDSVKKMTKRKAQKKNAVSKTVPPQPDEVAIASEQVEPDKVATSTRARMLRKRKSTQEYGEEKKGGYH
jgi:hypothetical protein